MNSVEQALRELFEWASERDFIGHDPHDLLSSPILGSVKNPFARLIALQIGRRSNIDLRKLLRVPKNENPKGIALFLMGLLRAQTAAISNWEKSAIELGDRLVSSMHENGGWGYPFPWQSRTHFLPANTPNIVTTSFAGTALVELYRSNPSPAILNAIISSARFIMERIPRVEFDNGTVFGYAENDPQIVFNASLLGAEFLLKAGKLLSIPEYVELARKAAEFVGNHQQADGGWPYGLEPSQSWVDSFHTGFVVVSMKKIAEDLSDERLAESARRGFKYYKVNFIEPDCAIRYFPQFRYPIDAHALGQAMVTFCEFGERETARRIAEWSIQNMRSNEGYFYYQRHRFFINRIAYIRWSNAWMFRGLSSVVPGFPGLLEVPRTQRAGNPPTTNG